MYKEIEGDLIQLALEDKFDVIAHGCNCFCVQKAGIARQMAEIFKTNKYPLENFNYYADINKLGQIEAMSINSNKVIVINAYTQYELGKNLSYLALRMCLKKINYNYKGKHIGLPQIGCGIAGGNWEKVKKIIQKELKDMDVTIVKFNK